MPPDPDELPEFDQVDDDAPADAEPVEEPEPSPKNDPAQE